MSDNHPVIGAVLYSIEMLVRGVAPRRHERVGVQTVAPLP